MCGRTNVGDFLRNGKSEKRQRVGMGDSPNLNLVIQIVGANLFCFEASLLSVLCSLLLPWPLEGKTEGSSILAREKVLGKVQEDGPYTVRRSPGGLTELSRSPLHPAVILSPSLHILIVFYIKT